jgi:hypothetical protein
MRAIAVVVGIRLAWGRTFDAPCVPRRLIRKGYGKPIEEIFVCECENLGRPFFDGNFSRCYFLLNRVRFLGENDQVVVSIATASALNCYAAYSICFFVFRAKGPRNGNRKSGSLPSRRRHCGCESGHRMAHDHIHDWLAAARACRNTSHRVSEVRSICVSAPRRRQCDRGNCVLLGCGVHRQFRRDLRPAAFCALVRIASRANKRRYGRRCVKSPEDVCAVQVVARLA